MVIRETLTKFGVNVTFIDTSDISAIEREITPSTKIIYFETPTNPTMKITDIQAVSELAHRHNIIVVVDNTFAPPPVQFPLRLGAGIVLHSVTKYLNGYGDVTGGAVIGRADDIKLISTTATTKICGSAVSPFNAFLTLRGLQTLELRMHRHCENAQAAAEYLEANPFVERVYYPGLKSSPQHKLAELQMNGMYSGIMSEEDRLKAGITDGMIRLSVGLENIGDIMADFTQVFRVLGG